MGDNEELQATETAGADDIIDLDDVEGHGLKEVAAGLGAAAVLAGGGAAALQNTGSTLPNAPQRDNVVASVDAAGQQAWDGAMATTQQGLGAADATVDAAGRTVASVDATADRVADGTLASATSVASAATKLATSTEKAALKTTGSVAHGATATADSTVDAAVNVADNVSVSNVSSTASSTVRSADLAGKIATVLKLETSTVKAAGSVTTGALTTVNAILSDTGTDVGASNGTGWVTFKVGGAVVGSVQLKGGQASITLNTNDIAGRTVTATYSGDGVHASCTNSTQG
jgi:hypothetical protein